MILTSLYLNPEDREVRRCLADTQRMHERLMSLFRNVDAPTARSALSVLYRLETREAEGATRVLLQSQEPPELQALPPGFRDPSRGSPSTRLDRLLADLVGTYRFKLHANTTRKIDTKTRPDGTKSNGSRVPLRREEDRLAWIQRQSSRHGFSVANGAGASLALRVSPIQARHGRRGSGTVVHEGTAFEGILIVTNGAQLREAVLRGVGPGKAYGFGLLSLAPVE
ncbi:MAG: type I-E CRISPR-associated protein Cas6/Cse3/CasE [Polyangiaceae bacterium]